MDRLSENAFTRLALYYILINYFSINNILYASAGAISFSDNLLISDYIVDWEGKGHILKNKC